MVFLKGSTVWLCRFLATNNRCICQLGSVMTWYCKLIGLQMCPHVLREGPCELVLNVHITLKITTSDPDTVVGGGTGGGGHTQNTSTSVLSVISVQHWKHISSQRTCYTGTNQRPCFLDAWVWRLGAANVCDMFCFGHEAAALCVISLSPGWLTRPVGFGCHTHSIQLAQSRTVRDTHPRLSASTHCTAPHTGPIRGNLQVHASVTVECKMNFHLISGNNVLFYLFIFKWHPKGPSGTKVGSLL